MKALRIQHMHAKSLQSCPTPFSPMDCSPPGSSVHGILQARILEWVAVSFTRHQIANIRWIVEKASEFQKNIYFCFIDYAKPLTVWITINCGKF